MNFRSDRSLCVLNRPRGRLVVNLASRPMNRPGSMFCRQILLDGQRIFWTFRARSRHISLEFLGSLQGPAIQNLHASVKSGCRIVKMLGRLDLKWSYYDTHESTLSYYLAKSFRRR